MMLNRLPKHSIFVIGIISLLLILGIGWHLSESIIQYFILLSEFSIMTVSPFEMIQTRFTISIVFAIASTLPIMYLVAYWYISPALYKKESIIVKWSTIPFFSMFILGEIFTIKVFLPVVLVYMNVFYTPDIVNSVTLNNYISFILSSMILFGAVFCIPLVLSILSYIGIINYNSMKEYRKHVYIGMLVSGAIITPPDIFTMMLVSIPLIILYEISIGVSYIMSIKSKDESKVISNA